MARRRIGVIPHQRLVSPRDRSDLPKFHDAERHYLTLVNGFNNNGGANEFNYVGTVSYNGEDFIKHDGCLTIGALMYEDHLASIE